MASKKYRSIVAGAGSVLGGRLAVLLARAGHEVIAAESPEVLDAPGGLARGRFEAARDAGAWVQTIDVSAAGALDPLLRDIDMLYVATRPREGDRSWKSLWRAVVGGTTNLVDASARNGGRLRRLALFSSASVAGFTGDGAAVDEAAPTDPRTDLARALSLAEHVVRRRCPEAGIPFTIVRPGHLVGADAGLPLAALFRPTWLPAVAVPAGDSGEVPLCHLDDACNAAVHLCKYASGANGTFFVTDGSRATVADLLRRVARARGAQAIPLPGVRSEWLGQAACLAVAADRFVAARRGRSPVLDPDLAGLLGGGLRVRTDRLAQAGFTPAYPDACSGLAALGAAVRGG